MKKDPCGYKANHPLYITIEELKNDPWLRMKIRQLKAERISKILVGLLAILGTALTAYMIRHYEYEILNKYHEIRQIPIMPELGINDFRS